MSNQKESFIFLKLSILQEVIEQCNWAVSVRESLVFIFDFYLRTFAHLIFIQENMHGY